jgi:hypothetical protein
LVYIFCGHLENVFPFLYAKTRKIRQPWFQVTDLKPLSNCSIFYSRESMLYANTMPGDWTIFLESNCTIHFGA